MAHAPLVKYLVQSIVNEPDAVTIDEEKARNQVVYTVHVAPNDVGKVIGKGGRVIACIRQVVGAASAAAGLRSLVKVDAE